MKKKKIVFISGATGRVGKALCHSFSNIGLNLIMTDVDEKKLISLKKKITYKYKNKVFYYQSDLSNFNSRLKLLKNIKKDIRSIDVIINNAGFTGSQRKKKDWLGNIYNQSIETWNEAL